jgi:hypothetical protein
MFSGVYPRFKLNSDLNRKFLGHFNTFLFSFLQAAIVLGVYSSAILSENLKPNPSSGLKTFTDLVRALERQDYYFVTSGDMGWFYVLGLLI